MKKLLIIFFLTIAAIVAGLLLLHGIKNNKNSGYVRTKEALKDKDFLIINGLKIEIPNDVRVIEQNERGVILAENTTSIIEHPDLRLGVGIILSPDGKCGHRVQNIDTGELMSRVPDNHKNHFEKRERYVVFNCTIETKGDGVYIPVFSYKKALDPYFWTDGGLLDFKNQIIKEIVTDHWNKQGFNRDLQTVSEIWKDFTWYMSSKNRIVFINEKPVIINGVSGIETIGVRNNQISFMTEYVSLRDFNKFLNSCEDNFIENYIKDINEKKPTLKEIERDLSCAGKVHFEPPYNLLIDV